MLLVMFDLEAVFWGPIRHRSSGSFRRWRRGWVKTGELHKEFYESVPIRFRDAAANGVWKVDPVALENISFAFFLSPFFR